MRHAVAGIALPSACASVGAPRTRADDESQIRAQVASLERTWNARNGAANAALFTETGDLIVLTGARHVGRAAVRAAWEAGWATADPGRRLVLTVDAVRFPTTDVAIAEISASIAGVPGQLDRATYVLVRREGQWLVEALRVMPAAAR